MAQRQLLPRAPLGLGDLPLDLAEVIPGPEPELRPRAVRTIPSEGRQVDWEIIPVCEPDLRGREKELVGSCVDTNWISSAGKFIPQFEEMFAAACGVKYAIACSNGTVALHLALAALGIGPGDEVILPTFTMIASGNAVLYCGATPILVDAEPKTWNMDVNQLGGKITEKTAAIMVVHIYGHPVDMDPVLEIAQKHNLWVIEDAAEAHGAEYKGKRIGGLSDAGCFSFYANKIITTGEGGMVTTDNEKLAQIVRNLKDHAFSEVRHFWHGFVGFNYRMTNLQAAVGVAQMERFEEMVENRRGNAAFYTTLLKNVPGITTPSEAPWAKNVFWMYGILVDKDAFGLSRDELRGVLANRGVETRTFFIPMHLQPIYRQRGMFKNERYPVAEELCKKGIYLPSASSLTEDQIEYVVSVIRRAHKGA